MSGERERERERERTGEDVRKHNSDQIAQHSREGGVKWSVSVSLWPCSLSPKNLTYNPKLNMIPSYSAPPTPPPLSGNKSLCNYQAGSITVTSLLCSTRLPRLQLTLTCSSPRCVPLLWIWEWWIASLRICTRADTHMQNTDCTIKLCTHRERGVNSGKPTR